GCSCPTEIIAADTLKRGHAETCPTGAHSRKRNRPPFRRSLKPIHTVQLHRTTMSVAVIVRARSPNRTRYRRKYTVRIASDQLNRANYHYLDDCQYYRIFGDVLALVVVPPEPGEKLTHICNLQYTARLYIRCQGDPRNSP